MKRIIAMTLAIACLLGLCGCNNNADSQQNTKQFQQIMARLLTLPKKNLQKFSRS